MFDEPPSLPMRAAIASLLGGLFGIGLILATHTAQAQAVPEPAAASERTSEDSNSVIRRIGDATLRIADSAELDAELGYVLARGAWGRGLATELGEKLLEVAFGWLGLHRIWASTDSENVASQHVLAKLGLRREAHFKQNAFVNGAYRDTLIFALTDAEYWANRAATHAS